VTVRFFEQERLDGVLTRLKRVHFKSLGGLLACQEALAEEGKLATGNPLGPPTTPVIATNG